MPSQDQVSSIVTIAVNVLRSEARKIGWDITEDTIATVANVLRPLLGFARLYAVKTATIKDERRALVDRVLAESPAPRLSSGNTPSMAPDDRNTNARPPHADDDDHNNPTL